ncbi:hypothetical protein [Oligoflexus tunisiensis]|uniref:hypothetical protein n=1 Tax=Oligoflexus tunisiensis TaxID=708132 RepID=UPI001C408554|nr:hypothetical protein [Oligoflexus tunisiensis]
MPSIPAKVVRTERSVSEPTKIPKDPVAESETPIVQETVEPAPDKAPEPLTPPPLDLKKFAIDEILALPIPEQKKFLTKNQLQHPEKFTRFRNISQPSVIEQYLKGDFSGKIEGKSGEEWYLRMNIDGEVEQDHFQGEIAVELLDKTRSPLSRSHLRGPLDDHIRVVEEGDRSSLLIQPTGPENVKLYQVFIGGKSKQQLTGNYYARNGEGKLQILGSFVLTKGEL